MALSVATQPADVRGLLRSYGSIESVFEQCCEPWQAERAVAVEERCEALGIRIIPYADAGYPGQLREIDLPPAVLYAAGHADRLTRSSVAMVGSRRCTAYGKWAARTLARSLSMGGVCVVSGMAFGIDAASHQGALDGPGGTVAVLGGGPERPSPASLAELYQRLVAEQLVISEFPPDTRPCPAYFPRRNRIVAGLSRGVVVVEAAARSGALITVRLALDAGREVFAVPGPVDSPTSVGSNRLLRQGAIPALRGEDVLESLGSMQLPLLDPAQQVLDALADGIVDLAGLVDRTGLPREQLGGLLMRMRLGGTIQAIGGDRYRRAE